MAQEHHVFDAGDRRRRELLLLPGGRQALRGHVALRSAFVAVGAHNHHGFGAELLDPLGNRPAATALAVVGVGRDR